MEGGGEREVSGVGGVRRVGLGEGGGRCWELGRGGEGVLVWELAAQG